MKDLEPKFANIKRNREAGMSNLLKSAEKFFRNGKTREDKESLVQAYVTANPMARRTWENINKAYETALLGLVKEAEKELAKYLELGQIIEVDLGDKFGKKFGRNGLADPDSYWLVGEDGKMTSWNGQDSTLTLEEQMEVYNILKEIIY